MENIDVTYRSETLCFCYLANIYSLEILRLHFLNLMYNF